MIKFDGDMSIVNKDTIELYNLYKKKAVFPVVITAKPGGVNQNRPTTNSIEFYDTRTETPYKVGKIWFDGSDYVVESDRIENEKYSNWNSSYHTKSSADIKRAAKNALEFIKPFTWKMVANQSKNAARQELSAWTHAPHSKINDIVRHTITYKDIWDVVEDALKTGTKFANDKFNKAIDVMRDNLDECNRRQAANLQPLFVCIDEHGRYASDFWDVPKLESELPEEIAGKIGLLKLLDVGSERVSETMNEVGFRTDGKTFWVFVPESLLKELNATKNGDEA